MTKTSETPALSVVSSRSTGIPPPRPLGPDGRALWDAIQAEYGIRDAGGIELLAQAAHALDLAQELAGEIAGDGAVIRDRHGAPKAHPAVRDELQARAFVVRTLERLGVTFEPVKAPGRPPRHSGWTPP